MNEILATNNLNKTRNWTDKIENRDVSEIEAAIDLLNKADQSGEKSDIMRVYEAITLINSEIYQKDLNTLKNRLKVIEKRAERKVEDSLGLTIKHYREQNGLTLQDVSEKAGVSISYIHRIEKGSRSMPSFPILERIANALGIPVSRLLPSTKETKSERVKIDDLLISGDVYIGNQTTPISFTEKELIAALVNFVYDAEWGDERAKDLLGISEIIDKIKSEYESRLKTVKPKKTQKKK